MNVSTLSLPGCQAGIVQTDELRDHRKCLCFHGNRSSSSSSGVCSCKRHEDGRRSEPQNSDCRLAVPSPGQAGVQWGTSRLGGSQIPWVVGEVWKFSHIGFYTLNFRLVCSYMSLFLDESLKKREELQQTDSLHSWAQFNAGRGVLHSHDVSMVVTMNLKRYLNVIFYNGFGLLRGR